MITAAQIKKLCPTAKPELAAAVVTGRSAMQAAGISTPLRISHFLATLAVETGGLRAIDENMSYTAERIRKVWPSRFKSVAAAKPYARNPEGLANKVYGGRLGNGPEASGDGWRYRGGGFIQTTGRSNYRAAGYESNPEALRQPGPGFVAAITFWTHNKINAIADRDDATAVRKKVNGGTHGLAEFKTYLAKAKRIFAGVVEPPVTLIPTPAPGFTPSQIKDVQRMLLGHGYLVGGIDGEVGDMTKDCISAFRRANGLPEGEHIDAQLIEMLKNPNAVRPVIAPERADATLGDLRAKDSEIVKGSDVQKISTAAAIAGTAASPIASIFKDSGDQVGEIAEQLSPFQTLLNIFTDYIWIPIILILGIVGWQAIRIARARLRDHVSGNTRIVNLPKAETGGP